MRNALSDIPYFVEVARHRSFTLAADALDMPIATLSRRITTLENELGIRLFRRTTRNVELTDEGAAYYKRCEFIVAEAKNAREKLLNDQRNPAGRVRMAIPAAAYFQYMKGSLYEFSARYPEIELHIHLATQWMDLATDPFDLELRAGSLPDSSLKVRRLATIHPGIYASPTLLEGRPLPRVPQDLQTLPCIHLSSVAGCALSLSNGTRTERVVFSAPRHTTNSPGVSLEFILAGQGIGGLELSIAEPYVAAGKLVRILPEWRTPGIDISLVMPPGSLPYRVRLFIDYLVELFADVSK